MKQKEKPSMTGNYGETEVVVPLKTKHPLLEGNYNMKMLRTSLVTGWVRPLKHWRCAKNMLYPESRKLPLYDRQNNCPLMMPTHINLQNHLQHSECHGITLLRPSKHHLTDCPASIWKPPTTLSCHAGLWESNYHQGNEAEATSLSFCKDNINWPFSKSFFFFFYKM